MGKRSVGGLKSQNAKAAEFRRKRRDIKLGVGVEVELAAPRQRQFLVAGTSACLPMIWFNGQLQFGAEMSATGAGALLGWGVFTTLAIRAGAPVFWARHCARLERDAQAARVELPYDGAQLRAGLDELLSALNLADGLARITGTRRGDGRWNGHSGADWSVVAQERARRFGCAAAPPGFAVSRGGQRAARGRQDDFVFALLVGLPDRARGGLRRGAVADRRRLDL